MMGQMGVVRLFWVYGSLYKMQFYYYWLDGIGMPAHVHGELPFTRYGILAVSSNLSAAAWEELWFFFITEMVLSASTIWGCSFFFINAWVNAFYVEDGMLLR